MELESQKTIFKMFIPKIVLIQPDSPYLSFPLAFPNLGLLYISSYLKKNNYSPKFYDLTGGIKFPEDLTADIFAFSCQITQFKNIIEIKNRLKKDNPDSLFVIGGPFPTHSPDECLNAGFDIAVIGEGELPILEIIKNFPDVKKGIYITNTWYTRFSNYLAGDFSTIPRDGIFLIEKGEIKYPIRGIRVSDNMLNVLKNVKAVGNDPKQILFWLEVTTPTIAPHVLVKDVNITKPEKVVGSK